MKVLTSLAIKAHNQYKNKKKGKSEGTRCMQGFETDPKNSLVDAQVH